jgi:hypothetical protein
VGVEPVVVRDEWAGGSRRGRSRPFTDFVPSAIMGCLNQFRLKTSFFPLISKIWILRKTKIGGVFESFTFLRI